MRTQFGQALKLTALMTISFALPNCGDGPHAPLTPLAGGNGRSSQSTNIDYVGTVKSILSNRCGTCHMPGGALPNWQDYQTTFSKKEKILQRVVAEKSMPPRASSTITEVERQEISDWISAGAPMDLSQNNSPAPSPAPEPAPAPEPNPAPVTPPDFRPIEQLVVSCMACHDHKGNSQQPNFPRIAGQTTTYLDATLKAFREKLRKEPEAVNMMWGMTQSLTDDQINLLAQYFNSRPTQPNKKGDAKLAAIGKDLFANGAPDRGIIACATCHGQSAEGSAIAPKLAGQHIEYLRKQFAAFRNGDRTESVMMPPIAKGLADGDEKALANYLQGL